MGRRNQPRICPWKSTGDRHYRISSFNSLTKMKLINDTNHCFNYIPFTIMIKTMRLLTMSLLVAVCSANYETSYLRNGQIRKPTWEDWEYLRDYWSQRIDDSTCPDEEDNKLKTHWDYNYDDFIAAGMNETEALSQDCELFHRERNPRSMGSRLVRHIFHDAAGGFDGFVNVSAYPSTCYFVLRMYRHQASSHVFHVLRSDHLCSTFCTNKPTQK